MMRVDILIYVLIDIHIIEYGEVMSNKERIQVKEYSSSDLSKLCYFFEECLPESGRVFEPNGAHAGLLHVERTYDYFICLIEQEKGQIIGTCALKRMYERLGFERIEKYHETVRSDVFMKLILK